MAAADFRSARKGAGLREGDDRSSEEEAPRGGPLRSYLSRRYLGLVAIVGGSLVLALGVYFGFVVSSLVDAVAGWTASWSSAVLNALGASTSADGTILWSNSFAVNVVAECTAVGPLIVFMGAVIAYPSAWRDKTIGLLMGLVVLSAVNLARIASLFWIGSNYPQHLDVAHLLVWQTAMIVLAILVWLVWVEATAGNLLLLRRSRPRVAFEGNPPLGPNGNPTSEKRDPC